MIFAFLGMLVLVWAKQSGTPWRDIGYVRPKSWIAGLIIGIVGGAAFKFAMKAIVMPLLGADPVNQTYRYLAGNRAAIPATLFLFIVGAGFGEETVLRGFLFERLGRLVGHGTGSKILIVVLTSALFALLHYPDQGLAGAEQAIFTGLVFGTIFAVTGRLWTVMCLHVAFDLTAYAMIYWNLETSVAHLVFK